MERIQSALNITAWQRRGDLCYSYFSLVVWPISSKAKKEEKRASHRYASAQLRANGFHLAGFFLLFFCREGGREVVVWDVGEPGYCARTHTWDWERRLAARAE